MTDPYSARQKKVSWYLQGCKFKVLDVLGRGRSLDALKRRGRACRIAEDTEDSDAVPNEFWVTASDSSAEAAASDLVDRLGELAQRLNPRRRQVLAWLTQGDKHGEIAKKLALSSKTVIRDHREIQWQARQIEIGAQL